MPPGPGRDDLEGRDLGEEGHRSGHPADRRHRAPEGVADVAASKRFYGGRGLAVAKSFVGKYVEFATPSSPVKFWLYGRRALGKGAGVPADGTGSHRLVIGAGSFTDPDGLVREIARVWAGRQVIGG
jgi:hypothetical protein